MIDVRVTGEISVVSLTFRYCLHDHLRQEVACIFYTIFGLLFSIRRNFCNPKYDRCLSCSCSAVNTSLK